MKESTNIFIPRDTAALSMGSDEVAIKIKETAEKSNISISIIRNGTWGMSWLEPLVEIEFKGERIAYGPVTTADVESLFNADFLNGGSHSLKLGKTTEIPFLKNQQRWTFRKCGLINPLSIEEFIKNKGFSGLSIALQKGSSYVLKELTKSGLRGRGGCLLYTSPSPRDP